MGNSQTKRSLLDIEKWLESYCSAPQSIPKEEVDILLRMQAKLDCLIQKPEKRSSTKAQAATGEIYAQIIESITDGLIALDRDWRIAYINSPAVQNGLFKPEELLGKNIWEAFPNLVGTSLERHYRDVMEHRVQAGFEMKGVYQDQWYLISVYPSQNGITVYWMNNTNRKQTEEKLAQLLRDNQRQAAVLSGIYEADPGALAVLVGPDLQFAYINPTYRFLIPDLSKDPVGQPYDQVWPKESQYALRKWFRRVIETGQPYQVQGVEYFFADGSFRIFTVQARRVDWNGQPACLVIYWDTTELSQTQRQLEQERAQLQAVLEQAPCGITIAEAPSGKLILGNQQSQAILRYSRFLASETIDQYREDYQGFHPDGRPYLAEEWPLSRSLLAGEVVHDEEIEILRGDGTRGYVLLSSAPIYEGGQIVAGVAILNDISERKKSEGALRESEQRYRSLFEAMQESLFAVEIITDEQQKPVNWRYMDVNPQLERFMGLTYTQMVGHTYDDVVAYPDPVWIEMLGKVALTGEPLSQVIYSHNTKRWLQVSAYSFHPKQVAALFFDVTERKNAELALQESEARLIDALEGTHDSFFALDRDWCITYVNRRYAEMMGRKAQDLVGANFWKAFPQYAGTPVEKHYRQAMEERTPVHFQSEGYYLQKWFEVSVHPTREGISVFSSDRTSEKKALDQAEAGQELLNNIIDSSPEIIFARDLDGRLILLNETLAQVYGMSKEQALGTTDYDIYDREIADRVRVWDQKVMAEKKAIRLEETIPVDGVPHTYITTKFPLRDGHGVIYGVGGVNADITERKWAEERLLESERTLRATFEQAAIGIVRASPEGRQLWVNEKFCQISGYTLEEAMTLSLEDVTYSEDLGREKQLIERVLSGEQSSYSLEKRYIRKDGVLIWVNLTASLVRDSSGAPLFFIKVIEDVSDRKAAERELETRNSEIRAMTEQLWQTARLATMGELAASVAHELNNPLAILSLRTENLAMTLSENSEGHSSLKIMEEEIERMAGIVANLLQFSRTGQQRISSLNLHTEVIQTLDLLHSYLLNRQIRVEEEPAPDLPLIHADRQQMRQLFLNLFTNASDAMPAGGTLTIRIQPEGNRSQVVIEVQDTGVGIVAQDLPRLMEPFFTTKPEGKGTGLGLGICRRIVEEHNGTFQISSPGENQGTTVRITLPVGKNDPAKSLIE